jgi:hypothetical protein
VPAGIQIWDASGNLIYDTTKRGLLLIASVTVSSNGSLSNSYFALGTPFVLHAPHVPDSLFDLHTSGYPDVTFSGTTMSWSYPGGFTPLTTTLHYGIC